MSISFRSFYQELSDSTDLPSRTLSLFNIWIYDAYKVCQVTLSTTIKIIITSSFVRDDVM